MVPLSAPNCATTGQLADAEIRRAQVRSRQVLFALGGSLDFGLETRVNRCY